VCGTDGLVSFSESATGFACTSHAYRVLFSPLSLVLLFSPAQSVIVFSGQAAGLVSLLYIDISLQFPRTPCKAWCAGRHCIPIEVSAFYWRSVARLAGRIRPPLRPSLGLLPAHRSRAVISSARGTAGCLRFLLSAAHCRRGIICGPLPLYYLSYLCRCALHNSRSYRLCRRGVARTVLRAHVYQPIIKKRKEWLACISHVHMSRRRGRRDETTVRRKRGN